MKFIHIADIHFDTPFTFINNKKDLGDIRRLEQRDAFKKVIEYIKENHIPYLFISGDLYEQNYIRKSTIEYINNLFKTIENTQIFISPGNHDPYLNNSYYNNFEWNSNVHIFNKELQIYEYENIDIYGIGFSDFYAKNLNLEEIEIKDKNKINILIAHGSLDASETLELEYNPINSKKIKQVGFDYIALGHIHKTNYNNEVQTVYPGSLISLGFDELGEHGMILGDIEKEKINLEFIKVDDRVFEEIELDVSQINSLEELVEEINNFKIEKNKMIKLILIGKRNFEINLININKLISSKNILKIKNNTKINYDLEKISKENSLQGFFVKEMLEQLKVHPEQEEKIKKSIEIGLDAMQEVIN